MAANPFRKQASRRAERILRSATASRWLAKAVFNRSDQLQQRLGEAAGQLKLLARMLLDWTAGRYRQVPWGTLLTITGALVYFLMPLDAIPDPIIGLGLLDDVDLVQQLTRREGSMNHVVPFGEVPLRGGIGDLSRRCVGACWHLNRRRFGRGAMLDHVPQSRLVQRALQLHAAGRPLGD